MVKEYKKSLEDEIDWKIIDQLHNATLNFSSKSLDIKKMLLAFVGILVPILIKLSRDKLDWSIFVALYITIFSFWILDSYTYFYQEKLRGMMNERFKRISLRNQEEKIIQENKEKGFTIEEKRIKKISKAKSLFNASHLIYLIMLIINLLCCYLFWKGIIS
jgi:hypothetical protein